jgi:MFS family permease
MADTAMSVPSSNDTQSTASAAWIVGLCTVINMIDGFDVLAASFTAPQISREWSLGARATGILLSSSLAGMTLGALFLSALADRWGRKRSVLAFLTLITFGMATAAVSRNLGFLIAARLVTGLGVGAMLPSINTVAAEAVSPADRDLAVSIQGAGFPAGAVVAGLTALLLGTSAWQYVFIAGALFSLALIPAVAVGFRKVDHPKPTPHTEEAPRMLSTPVLRVRTLLICSSFFFLMFSFYFLTSWMPKMLADNGYSIRAGISGAILLNVGGLAGDVVFSLFMMRWRAGAIGPAFMCACFASTLLFALAPFGLALLVCVAVAIGFLLFGSILSLYALAPRIYPAKVRATGTGVALGVGRVGATLGPYVGGVLISLGWSRPQYVATMSLPLLISAALAWVLQRDLPDGPI